MAPQTHEHNPRITTNLLRLHPSLLRRYSHNPTGGNGISLSWLCSAMALAAGDGQEDAMSGEVAARSLMPRWAEVINRPNRPRISRRPMSSRASRTGEKGPGNKGPPSGETGYLGTRATHTADNVGPARQRDSERGEENPGSHGWFWLLGRIEAGGPTSFFFFFFYVSFSLLFLNPNLNFNLDSNFCGSSVTNFICALKSTKFENIYLNILFIFLFPSSFFLFSKP
jgi:hypothetical protein